MPNYNTLNSAHTNLSVITLSNGNLTAVATNNGGSSSNIGFTSGKWYFEATVSAIGVSFSMAIGVINATGIGVTQNDFLNNGWFFEGGNALKYDHSIVGAAHGSTPIASDVIMCAIDADTNKIWWGLNGTFFNSGDPAAGTNAAFTNLSGTLIPSISIDNGDTVTLEFGARGFAFTPPTGFLAVNTQNLDDPAIDNPGLFYNTVTYQGIGVSQGITDVNFEPDFVWLKNRDQAFAHHLHDKVRGAALRLVSNSTEFEVGVDSVTSFDVDGFTVGTSVNANGSGDNIVAWNWKQAATPGFDIVTYTGNGAIGRLIPHSLGSTPSLILLKHRTGASNWRVFHQSIGIGSTLFLNDNIVAAADPDRISAVSSITFGLSTGNPAVNQSGQTYIAYLWSEIEGFSKFGSYVGNGSTDGPFIYCGFRPAFVLIKEAIGSVGNWRIADSARNTGNPVLKSLLPNEQSNEIAAGDKTIDFLSNGFKVRENDTDINQSGSTMIFAAFAESPIKHSKAFGPARPPSEQPPQPTLIQAITSASATANLQFALDAGDINSYSGSGDKWIDTSGNGQDFFRGPDGTTNGQEPTFNGVAGAITVNEYFESDGNDFFRYDQANEPWMETLHKDGALFSTCMWIFPTTLTMHLLSSYAGFAATPGIRMFADSSGPNILTWNILGGGFHPLFALSQANTMTTGAWQFIGLSFNENGGNVSFMYRNGATVQMSSPGTGFTFNGNASSPSGAAATGPFEIGTNGSGTFPQNAGNRFAAIGCWDTPLTVADFDSIFNSTRGRFGL